MGSISWGHKVRGALAATWGKQRAGHVDDVVDGQRALGALCRRAGHPQQHVAEPAPAVLERELF